MTQSEKGVAVVAGKRNIHTSLGKVLSGEVSEPLPADEAKDFIDKGLAAKAD